MTDWWKDQQARQGPQFPSPPELDLPWIDQLAQNILLTAEAFQRLHMSLDGKFTR